MMLCIIMLVLSSADSISNLQATHDEAIKYLEISQVDNLSRLLYGSFTFEVVQGVASDIEAASRGEIQNSIKAKGKFLFDEKSRMYECVYDDDDILGSTTQVGPNQLTVGAMSTQMLTDGKTTCLAIRSTTDLAARKVGYSVELFQDAEGSRFRERFDFVLPIGMKHPKNRFTADVASFRDGQLKLKELDLDFDFAGRKTSKVVFQSPSGRLRIHILDMERGGLPLELQDVEPTGTVVNTVRYEEFERIRDQCWLPRKKVVFSPLGKGARVIKLISRDADRRPASREFKLGFLTPVQIPDLTTKTEYEHVSEFEFNASPALKSHVKPMRFRPSSDAAPPVMPGELKPGSWAFPIMLCSACCLVLGVLVFVFKRR